MYFGKWMVVRRKRVSWLLRQEQMFMNYLSYGNFDKVPEYSDEFLPKNTNRLRGTDYEDEWDDGDE